MKLTYSDIIEDFFDFEKENNYFSDKKIFTDNWWEYIRFSVCEELIKLKFNNHENKNCDTKSKNHLQKVIRHNKYLINGIIHRLKNYNIESHYDIVIINIDRYSKFNGKYVNVVTYPVIEHLSKKYKILAVNQSFEYNKSDYPCDIITITDFTIIDMIRTFFIKLKADELKLLKEVERNIYSRFKVTVELTSIFKNRIIQNSSIKKMQYKKLFNNIKPKALIYCSDGSMQGIVESANCLDIKTIELQHGHINNLHPFYFSKRQNNTLINNIIPDYFFSFGDLWNNSIKCAKKVISVGSPIFDYNYNKYFKEKRGQNLFVISAGVNYDYFTKLINELANKLPDKTIYFKLRIEEYSNWRKLYGDEIDKHKNVIIINDDSITYFEYFNLCSTVIGIDSTLLIDALQWGLEVIIIKVGWYEQMKSLYEKKIAYLAKDIDSVIKTINKNKNTNNIQKKDIVLFQANPLINIKKEIQNIFSKK